MTSRKGLLVLVRLVTTLLCAAMVAAPQRSVPAIQPDGSAGFTAVVEGGAGSEAAGVSLRLELPAQAQVDDLVTFTLMGDGAQGMAGFVFSLHYDEAGLDFYRAELSAELEDSGLDLLEIGPVRQEGMVLFGAASCPVSDCTATDYAQPKAPAVLGDGSQALAQLHFFVRAPGLHALRVDRTQIVGRDGLLTIDRAAEAPAVIPIVDLRRLDLTENGLINDSDAWAIIGAWGDLAAAGECITPALAHYDIDGSGCIDLPDVQMILAHWGETAVSNGAPKPTQVDPAPGAETITAAVTADLALVVNDAGDGADTLPGDGICATAAGRCTLRAAIGESNSAVGADTITFNIRNTDGTCPSLVAIQPASNLHIDDPRGYGITIDGYSQCGAAPNTQPIHGNAVIKIELRGNRTAGVYGLFINSQNNTIRGLSIFNFNYQLLLRGSRSHHNRIEGNFLGTNAANTHTTNFPGENDGIRVDRNSSHNTFGGVTPDKRNLVSGNDQDGIGLQGSGITGNLVIGNYVGLAQDGVTRLRNSSDGVDIAEGAFGNRFGGLNAGERNVFAGNGGDGIEISHGGSHDNEIVGNFIGLNATGASITRNNKIGITFEDTVINNRFYRNIVVGMGGSGVRIYTSNQNRVFDNFIGAWPLGIGAEAVVPEPGTVPLDSLAAGPNGQLSNGTGKSGVHVLGGSQGNLILRNVIANNPEYGVGISAEKGYLAIGTCETYFNTISENAIFNNASNGIRLISRTCDGVSYTGNQALAIPRIRSATMSLATGTACANCTVEIFVADKTVTNAPSDNNGEGKRFITRGTADSGGSFTIGLNGAVSSGEVLTATSTSLAGNTSQFARNVVVRTTAGSVTDSEAATINIYLPTVIR